jgi:hypothetical protein
MVKKVLLPPTAIKKGKKENVVESIVDQGTYRLLVHVTDEIPVVLPTRFSEFKFV